MFKLFTNGRQTETRLPIPTCSRKLVGHLIKNLVREKGAFVRLEEEPEKSTQMEVTGYLLIASSNKDLVVRLANENQKLIASILGLSLPEEVAKKPKKDSDGWETVGTVKKAPAPVQPVKPVQLKEEPVTPKEEFPSLVCPGAPKKVKKPKGVWGKIPEAVRKLEFEEETPVKAKAKSHIAPPPKISIRSSTRLALAPPRIEYQVFEEDDFIVDDFCLEEEEIVEEYQPFHQNQRRRVADAFDDDDDY
jgi:hypothetical protein